MRFLFIFIPLLISTAHAATVNISVSCGSQGQLNYSMVGNDCQSTGYVDGPSPILDGAQFGKASGSVTYEVSGNSIWATAETSAAATVQGSAAASVSFTDTVFVPGSGRGYMNGTYNPGVPGGYGGKSSNSYEVSNSYGVLSACSDYGYICQVPYQGTYLFHDNLIPITLGQLYTISLQTMSGASSDDNTPSYRGTLASIGLNFYGADGVTPVAISETPEPGTFALALLPLAFFGYRKIAQLR